MNRCLRELDHHYAGRLKTLSSNSYEIDRAVTEADLVIGSVLIPGAKAPKLVNNDHVKRMKPGSVLVDIAIDQVELVQLGAKASPLISKSSDLVAARAIKQGQAEIDFDFPLPVADEFGYSSADSIETESSPWAAPTASLVSKPS